MLVWFDNLILFFSSVPSLENKCLWWGKDRSFPDNTYPVNMKKQNVHSKTNLKFRDIFESSQQNLTFRDNLNLLVRASLVAQWLRICLPVQGTRVRALVWEDPTCRGATGPVSHNYWACASGACAPQQEKPRQWEARALWWRVAPACRN